MLKSLHFSITLVCLHYKTQVSQQLGERMDKWDYMKLKSFTTKEMVSKLKRPPTKWEKILLAIHQTRD
jgi:hypothetical protein